MMTLQARERTIFRRQLLLCPLVVFICYIVSSCGARATVLGERGDADAIGESEDYRDLLGRVASLDSSGALRWAVQYPMSFFNDPSLRISSRDGEQLVVTATGVTTPLVITTYDSMGEAST